LRRSKEQEEHKKSTDARLEKEREELERKLKDEAAEGKKLEDKLRES